MQNGVVSIPERRCLKAVGPAKMRPGAPRELISFGEGPRILYAYGTEPERILVDADLPAPARFGCGKPGN